MKTVSPAGTLFVSLGNSVPRGHENPEENIENRADTVRQDQDGPDQPNEPRRDSEPIPESRADASEPSLLLDPAKLGPGTRTVRHRCSLMCAACNRASISVFKRWARPW